MHRRCVGKRSGAWPCARAESEENRTTREKEEEEEEGGKRRRIEEEREHLSILEALDVLGEDRAVVLHSVLQSETSVSGPDQHAAHCPEI